MSSTPGIAILVAVAIVTFFVSGFWWISGVQGGSAGEAGPIGTTIFITLAAAGILYAFGWL